MLIEIFIEFNNETKSEKMKYYNYYEILFIIEFIEFSYVKFLQFSSFSSLRFSWLTLGSLFAFLIAVHTLCSLALFVGIIFSLTFI